MPRKKVSVWLNGLDLLTRLAQLRPKPSRAARKLKAVKPKAVKPAPPPRTTRAGPPKPHRTPAAPRTRSAGRWLRSFHSAPPLPGQLVNHLAYALYLPASAPSPAGLPLVVMLHGCKQGAESFAAGTRICRLAERAGFAVLFPEQAKTAHAHRCWHWHESPAQSEAPAVVSLVAAMLRQHGFDRERVYLAGMSAGAGLAAVLAVHYPALFAAVGLHSGPVFGAAHSAIGAMRVMRSGSQDDPLKLIEAAVDVAAHPGMPALVVHGERDAVVAKRNATQLGIEFARLNRLIDAHGEPQAGARRASRRGGVEYLDHLKAGRLVVRVGIVDGLGHAWSGGDAREPFHSGRGPEASAMMWQFFRRQRRVATEPA